MNALSQPDVRFVETPFSRELQDHLRGTGLGGCALEPITPGQKILKEGEGLSREYRRKKWLPKGIIDYVVTDGVIERPEVSDEVAPDWFKWIATVSGGTFAAMLRITQQKRIISSADKVDKRLMVVRYRPEAKPLEIARRLIEAANDPKYPLSPPLDIPVDLSRG